jgi:hypothetical protein
LKRPLPYAFAKATLAGRTVMESWEFSAGQLDTLAKVLAGAISALGGGWLSGVFARRRVLQRHLRSISQELELQRTTAVDIRSALTIDIAAAAENKHYSPTIRRLPQRSMSPAHQARLTT